MSNINNKELTKKTIFAATGKFENFTRESLKTYIEGKGHVLLDKISKNANYLINNDIKSSSEKNKYAMDNNIPIISENEMICLLGQQIKDSFKKTKSDIRITHNLDSRINIEELVGYYNKYPSKNIRIVKTKYLEDIDIDENSLFYKFDKLNSNYAKCNEDVEVGDFLLLDSGEVVLVSKYVEYVESNAKIHNSVFYFKKTMDETDHKYGIFYEDAEFDVEEQSYRFNEPHDGFFSMDLKEFAQGNYQSDTLIYNSFFGFISKNDDIGFNESVIEIDHLATNDSFWDRYSGIFDMHSKNGIPKFDDINLIDKDMLIKDERIKTRFDTRVFFDEAEYYYIQWGNTDLVEKVIQETLSSHLTIGLAYSENEALLLIKGEKDHLFLITESSTDDYELIGRYDLINGFSLEVLE